MGVLIFCNCRGNFHMAVKASPRYVRKSTIGRQTYENYQCIVFNELRVPLQLTNKI